MRAVSVPEPGVVEVNWSWLPTFLGMNKKLQDTIVQNVHAKLEGQPLTEAVLDRAHDLVVDEIIKAFPKIEGLREHLDGLKYIRYME